MMKNNKLNNFIKASYKIALQSQEKADIKHILTAYIDQTVRGTESIRLQNQRSRKISLIRTMPILLALMLTFTGGTALAANGSLPGDFLYPVKVNFNEKVRGALAFSGEAEANFQSEMAARRLEEFQELAASTEGEFEAQLRESIMARFEAHSKNALDQIESLNAQGKFDAAAAASARLEASLEAHEDLIQRLSEQGEDIRARLLGMLDRVHARTEVAAEARANAVARVGENLDARLEAIVEAKAKQAEQALSASERLLDKYESRLSGEAKAEAKAKTEAALEAQANGMTALEAGNYAEAYRHFQASISFSEQAQIVMRVWSSFKIGFFLDEEGDDSEEDSTENDSDEDSSDEDENEDQDDEDRDKSDEEDGDSDEQLDLDARANGDADINIGSGGAGVSGNAGASNGVGIGL
ncbi:MAG: DUF5667 domain-containing protein [bacterium]|nr:DUF5667 domain-containing protein [bacterium]MDZ4231378.1 DUF5667 domain-containing protein [Patescibacteria group bacterium]